MIAWEEWTKLRNGDYVYRESDGWGGTISQQPSNIYIKGNYNNGVKKRPAESSLSLRITIKSPDYKLYPSYIKFDESKDWRVLNVAESTDAIALAKYAIHVGFSVSNDLINLANTLSNRSVL